MADKLTWKTFPWNAFSPSDIVSFMKTSYSLEFSQISPLAFILSHLNVVNFLTPSSLWSILILSSHILLLLPKTFFSDFSINILWVSRIAYSFFVFSIPPWSERAKIILKHLQNVLWYNIFQYSSIPFMCSFKLLSSGSKSEILSVPVLPLMGETSLPTVDKIRQFFMCNECI